MPALAKTLPPFAQHQPGEQPSRLFKGAAYQVESSCRGETSVGDGGVAHFENELEALWRKRECRPMLLYVIAQQLVRTWSFH
jgi:hypothetical protein